MVMTHHPEDAPDEQDVTYVSSGVESSLNLAFEKVQAKNVVLFGASIASRCLDAWLIGEMIVHIVPARAGTFDRRQPGKCQRSLLMCFSVPFSLG